jgi:DNA-binding response OmpR family regulator
VAHATVDVHVRRLREKIPWLVTHRDESNSSGYKLDDPASTS